MGMPNFLIVGAPKAGTTALYHYLKQHPEIYMSSIKEPGFFDYGPERRSFCGPGDQALYRTAVSDIESYRKLFQPAENESAIGEASVYYLYSPVAAERIHSLIPDAKLIVVLRNPAERAYSAFLHNLSDGREPLTDFGQALGDEPARLRQGFSPFWYYRTGGFYHRYLQPYFDRFTRDQLSVHLYEDFVGDPIGVLRQLFRFLEVDDQFAPDVSLRYNVSGVPKIRPLQRVVNRPGLFRAALKACLPARLRYLIWTHLRIHTLVKPPYPAQVRAGLVRAYREDILKLQVLIRRDLSAWLQ